MTAFGDAVSYGSTSSVDLAAPVTGMARTATGAGYWEAAADGGVFAFGDATYLGSMTGHHLNAPITGIAATPTGHGYWLVGADGGVFAFGDATYLGSMTGHHLNASITGIAATPTGHGYWLVGADGGVFAFGDATYLGSVTGHHLNAPITGIAATPTGHGYWLVGADGGVFAFGDATYLGSVAGLRLDQPITGIASDPGGAGYWLVGADGGVFSFGKARFFGSFGGGAPLYMRFVGLTPTRDGGGYWLVASGFCSSPGSLLPSTSSGSPAPPVASLVEVSAAPLYGCAAQVQFRFAVPGPASMGYNVRYVTQPVLGASGLPVHIAGRAFLQITLTPAYAHDYTGPTDIFPVGVRDVVELRLTEDFEGYVTWVVGLDRPVPFWVGLPSPGANQFLIVDIG